MSEISSISTKIAQLAARQWGHVTRRQLLALGLGAEAISYRVKVGQLIPVHNGVYALGYRRVEPVARAAAAVLACGPTAVLSHDSAAALWGLRRWPRRPEITAPRCIRRAGITAHRSTTLTASEITTQLGVRTTTAARALREIRRRLNARQFTRLVNQARLDRLIGSEVAEALLGRPGNPTRSELEDAFRRFVERYHLPRPQVNVMLGGHEVDVLWPRERVIVELDGWDTHRDRRSFHADRERDAAHAAAGYLTVRITWQRLHADPAREAARLRRILALRIPSH